MPRLYFPVDDVQKRALIRWACERLPRATDIPVHLAAPIGILDDQDKLLAVAIWHDYVESWGHMSLTAAAVPRSGWCTRSIMRGLLAYPFRQLGVRKLLVHIETGNERAMRFAKVSGMKREAMLRHHFARHAHALVYSMMDFEYRRSPWAALKETMA